MPGNYPKTLMPHPGQRSPRKARRRYNARLRAVAPVSIAVLALALSFFSLPSLLGVDLKVDAKLAENTPPVAFPVTVNPKTKTITESPSVNAYLTSDKSSLSAAVGNATNIFTWVASQIASLQFYQQVAGVAGTTNVFVTIKPGYREEQVASLFGSKLHWTTKQRQTFLTNAHTHPPILTEGEFVPGTYELPSTATPLAVQTALYDRFIEDIGSRYGTTTAQIVPVSEALTIASLLEREAGGPDDMRLISGIIWNRLFKGMNLQIDATLQYAKASGATTGNWWPVVVPKDKYIKSAYNTYAHAGLPPGPISSVSVASVLAALNPKKTDCLFYFHDSHSQFHCSVTYAQHVALLKKYYGQGK